MIVIVKVSTFAVLVPTNAEFVQIQPADATKGRNARFPSAVLLLRIVGSVHTKRCEGISYQPTYVHFYVQESGSTMNNIKNTRGIHLRMRTVIEYFRGVQ